MYGKSVSLKYSVFNFSLKLLYKKLLAVIEKMGEEMTVSLHMQCKLF